MKLIYLGTAAAEGWPALFCDCDNCLRAKAAGGKNIRTRSQAIIDGELLIDFPADTYSHVLKFGIDTLKIHTLIFTHSHADHFYPNDLEMFRPPFGNAKNQLRVYSNKSVYNGTEEVRKSLASRTERPYGNMTFEIAEPFKPFSSGKYKITPLPADHDASQTCLVYVIDDGASRLLYANDTGYFPDATWDYIKGIHFDLVSLDCTFGLKSNRRSHMSIDVCAEVKDRLLETGCDRSTRFVLNHFSHNGGADYDEIMPQAEKLGFDVSYDGKEVIF
jgi:phosphoribosyl 1,2-cyclic phosphate phosphodiesterase